MLSDLLNRETIQLISGEALTWQEAIGLAAKPLVENNSVTTKYVDAMIKVVDEEGPYINIGDHVALAHTRPENGSNRISLALLKTTESVNLVNADHPVTLWFVLSAVDNQSHLQVIRQLMMLLTNEKALNALKTATSVDDLIKVIATIDDTTEESK